MEPPERPEPAFDPGPAPPVSPEPGPTRPDDATERMSTQPPPPEPPTSPPEAPPGGPPALRSGGRSDARLPVPGNAEWLLWFCVEFVFAIIWAASGEVTANDFLLASAVITFAYLISRGIAKAGRVLEH